VNPGIGSGSHGKTTVGGPEASFGIWHELVPQTLDIAEEHSLKITTIHMHIGSGSDATLWM
jgi:diaminopimelate decarboxylase